MRNYLKVLQNLGVEMLNKLSWGKNNHNKGEFSEPHNIGLKQITYRDQVKADIVFVHGLGGNPFSTWDYRKEEDINKDNKDDFWSKWLGDELKCQVWLFGYDAARTVLEKGQEISLYSHANSLFTCLKTEKAKDIGERPLFFITHSLGGLVVKKMLEIAQSNSSKNNDQKAKNILEKLKGVIFIATPHNGASLANLASLVPMIPSSILKQLKKNDPELEKINNLYKNIATKYKIATLPFYELYNVKSNNIFQSRVVSLDSANPHAPNQESLAAIQKDHIAIAKCQTQDDTVYSLVKQFIQKCLPVQNDKDNNFNTIWLGFRNNKAKNLIPCQ